nr:flocculation protein FLO11-like [Aedes albopictus]
MCLVGPLLVVCAKRAAWRWAKDRASVAARWTWLLAQISDLEYRIRQHNELHNKIKVNKGAVTLEDASYSFNQPPSQQSVNGYRGTLPGNTKPLDDSYDSTAMGSGGHNGAYDQSGGSCRTRPFHRNGFRKRKLLQTANLHTISKKAARPSTVKCGCAWPLHPCALCTGRQDPTAPRDLPDTMPASDRVALLDPCFHPVLSFPEDVSHSIHFEAIMRIPEWQNKMIRCTAKSLSKSIAQKSGFTSTGSSPPCGVLPSSATPSFLSSGDEATTSLSISGGNKKYGPDGKRKYNKHKHSGGSPLDQPNHKLKKSKSRQNLLLASGGSRKSSSAGGYPPSASGQYGISSGYGATPGASSNKYYKSSSSKYRKSSHSSTTTAMPAIGGHSRYNSGGYDYMDPTGMQQDGAGSGSSRSKNSSPTPNHHRNERKNRTSYDIDNIVIPYSVAAANRVEILQYKEITTPKWRVVDDNEDSTDLDGTITNKTHDTTADSGTLNTSQPLKAETGDKLPLKVPAATGTTAVKPSQSVSVPVLPTSAAAAAIFASGPNKSASEGQLIVLPAIDEEDISDETILVKHDRALQDERKKFQTYMKFPWSRPRANRRIDSRAESSGGNTPDPTSPAPPTPLVDHESNTSPACPSTPLTPLDSLELSETNVINALNQSLNKKERRRTVSSKTPREELPRSSSPEIREIIPPYEPLQFPLADEIYEDMVRTMPSDHLALVEDAISKLTRPNRTNNNVLLINRNNLNLVPSSSGHIENPLSSNLSTTSTTLSATENDLDDLDCEEEELLQAKKVENQIIMEKLLKNCDENRMFVGVREVLDDDDPMDDEETDTGESLFVEEDDPNDPEWYDRPGRGRT